MRRKYDIRNKKNFAIILFLSIAIIGIFSFFIYKYRQASKIMYTVPTGSIVQDVSKNFISVEEDATLRIRWNDNYYLMYQDQKINLGKKVIVYNSLTNNLNLYGTYYEIGDDGKVTSNMEETIINNSSDAKFYKLDDREYLLVSKAIVSDDRSISTSDYLLVELDKLGNAKLSNYTLNLKTISNTILGTTNYRFDIANEKLIFDKLTIDLKKIIGSTNEYDPEEEKNNNSQSQNNGQVTWNSGTGSNGTGINNNTENGQVTTVEEIKNKAKMTSVVLIKEGIKQIDVDYVIYDPYNEYKSIYAEITKESGIEVVHLSKSDTHITFNNLLPNTNYPIRFIYTIIDEKTGKLIPYEFYNDSLDTKMPEFAIEVYGFSSDKILTYKVISKDNYPVNKINVKVSFKYQETNSENKKTGIETDKSPKSIVAGTTSVLGTIDLSDYNISRDYPLILTIDSVESSDGLLNVDKSYSFRLLR